MVKIQLSYEGDLHCNLTHGPSGVKLATDAPKDNMGKGESFSPTDLVASALGACILTIMGIYCKRNNIKLEGATAEVIKEMIQEPVRRIGKLTVLVKMPAGLTPEQRKILEKVAHTCPVHKSLHPDIEISISFSYSD